MDNSSYSPADRPRPPMPAGPDSFDTPDWPAGGSSARQARSKGAQGRRTQSEHTQNERALENAELENQASRQNEAASDPQTSAPQTPTPQTSTRSTLDEADGGSVAGEDATDTTPEGTPEEVPAQDDASGDDAAGDDASGETSPQKDATSLFQEALEYMNANDGCMMNLMLAPAAEGKKLRLTITGQHVEAEGKDTPDGPPFRPVTLVDFPETLDDPNHGLEQFLRERTGQVQTLSEARSEAEEACKQATEAEKRRKEKAKQKKAENSENGPLFGDDSDDE